MRTPENGKEAERRRRRALAMARDGQSAVSIGRALGIHPRTVRRWKAAFRRGRFAALKTKVSPGRPHRLSVRQRRDMTRRLLRGAIAEGFATDLWTCPRIGRLIEQRYAIRYHVDHIPRLMRTLGFSPQKAERRARERDEPAIREWIVRDWRGLKKRPPGSVPGWFLSMKPACF